METTPRLRSGQAFRLHSARAGIVKQKCPPFAKAQGCLFGDTRENPHLTLRRRAERSRGEVFDDLDQAEFATFQGSLGPVAHTELPQDIGYVVLNGSFRQVQLPGDLLVAGTGRDQA